MINGRFPVFALFFGVLVGLAVLMLALAAFSALCLAAGISGGAAVNALPLVAACFAAALSAHYPQILAECCGVHSAQQ